MTDSLQSIPPARLETLARETALCLQQAGHVAYWAGGCVRDRLLHRPPRDYDIATSAHPDAVAARFPGSVLVGKSFGVVRAPYEEATFDIATFRSDSAYSDGRHPDRIVFADAAADAQRRDFTVNAIFFDPVAQTYIDFVGGRADLERRILRCVGDPLMRFREDHLRLLRAVRFATTLEFELEPATEAALRACAPSLTTISAERIRDELTRILIEAPHAGQALHRMDDLGLLAPILPEVVALKGQAQPPEFHPEGDVFTHTMMMLDSMQTDSPILAYAVLLHDIGKPPTATLDGERIRFSNHDRVGADMATDILRRLRFSNDQVAAITHCVRNHMRFRDVQVMKEARRRRMIAAPHFDQEMELHRLDCESSHRKLENYAFLVAYRQSISDTPALPPPLINGSDAMAAGIPEGPEIGQWLRRAYDEQLDGRITTREAMLDWLGKRGAEPPSGSS